MCLIFNLGLCVKEVSFKTKNITINNGILVYTHNSVRIFLFFFLLPLKLESTFKTVEKQADNGQHRKRFLIPTTAVKTLTLLVILKIVVRIKTYLLTSNGELLII